MDIGINDKVRFLNEPGEGVVIEIISDQEVRVEREDGFDYPMNIQELVVVGSKNDNSDIVISKKLQKSLSSRKQTRPTFSGIKSKSQPKTNKERNRVEVDLHPDKLLPHKANIPKNKILEYQLTAADRAIKAHLNAPGFHVILICGQGIHSQSTEMGLLRQHLKDYIRKNFKKCEVQDGKFKDYGEFGALDVVIHQ